MFQTGTWGRAVADQLAYGMPLYNLLYIVGIVFFCYFYTAIIFNPDDVAENMRKYGGFIPGIVQGSGRRNTSTRSWRASPSLVRCIWPPWRSCRSSC
jgi:preprotein translocase subunit SecY